MLGGLRGGRGLSSSERMSVEWEKVGVCAGGGDSGLCKANE